VARLKIKKWRCSVDAKPGLPGWLLAVGLIVLASVFLTYCSATSNEETEQTSLLPLVFDATANESFIQAYAKEADLNEGLTIARNPFLVAADGTTPPPNYFSMTVLNHSDEPIHFPDQGFGLRTFVYDPEKGAWSEIVIQRPAKNDVTLPAKLERYDATINNKWTIPNQNFEVVDQREVRIYILGTGEETGRIYGAFYDLSLKP
jgi:hypothetical protein